MITKYLLPDYYIHNFQELNLSSLKEKGIKILLLDLDNTLISHENSELDNQALLFIKNVKEHKIRPVILSNNLKSRVSDIADQANVDFYCFSCKPSRRNYKKVCKTYHVEPKEVAVLGDQLVTDILGGKRSGCMTILQDPLTTTENIPGKVTRKIESIIFNHLEKKGQWKRGKYDERL